MKVVTKEQERKLNKLPLYEKRYKAAFDRMKEDRARLTAKANAMNDLIGDVKPDDPRGVPPNYLEILGLRNVFNELAYLSWHISEIELRLIRMEAGSNSDSVILDILSRYMTETMKKRIPVALDSMRSELIQVKRDLAEERKVARRAKRWLIQFEKHRPKIEKPSDFP